MKFVSKLSYIIAVAAIFTALVGCPVVQPDDTVKITDLQTAIDKAASGDTIMLSNYGDITDYNATINKSLTIVGADGLSDFKNATLTVTADNVTIKGIFKANVVITTAVKKLCTISNSTLDTLSVSGCSIGKDSGLVLDSTTVTSAIFEQNGIDYSDLQHLSLTIQGTENNSVSINELKCRTYLAIIEKNNGNAITSLSIEPDEQYGSCVAVLPSLQIANKALNIATVSFYDSTLENSDTPARIDCMVLKDNTGSMVNRDFFKKACDWLLGNVYEEHIPLNRNSSFGMMIANDVSEDIPNMVDTVNITFHNNLADATTDVRKIIKNGEYLLPTIQFDHADNVTLYGWSTNSGTNNQKHYDCDKVFRFNKDTDLYAVWKPIYTISYRDKDVTSDVTFDAWMTTSDWTEYVVDQNVVLPTSEDVTKDGYIFQGWYADKYYNGSAISGWSANTKTGNQTFYAKWEYCVSLSDILFRSGNETMTVKWTNPNNASLSKVRIRLSNGKSYDVTADAGQSNQQKFTNLTNGSSYTAYITAIDNKGNESKSQTINNYCGSYIGTDGSLYIKSTKYEKTALKTVIKTSTDVTGDGTNGVFVSGRTVTLSPYRIGQYEVTQKLYQAITGSNPSSHIGDNYPVENVSRYDCLIMCRKLNDLFGYENASANDETVDITKEGFRLPTEAEWEFAARGGDPSADAWDYIYSGSNTIGNVAWFVDNASKTTHEVGTKTANALGIYDMSGNVWEWVADIYKNGLYMQCGGGYSQTDNLCTVTSRTADYNGKGSESKVCGFRLAINVEAE